MITNDGFNSADALLLLLAGASGIEAQEKRGQIELINSAQLPVKHNDWQTPLAQPQYEKMGIKVIGPSKGDTIFLDVELPEGWKKQRTDHSMWSNLIDDKGRERASIFYKGAFYDRDAFVNFNTRYRITSVYPENYKYGDRAYYIAEDCGKELFRTEKSVSYEDDDIKRKECSDFLNENYPNWKDVNAYWND